MIDSPDGVPWAAKKENLSNEGCCRSETVRGEREMPADGAGSVRGGRRRQQPSADRQSAGAHARKGQACGKTVSPPGHHGQRRLEAREVRTRNRDGNRGIEEKLFNGN